jgi:hypothetical protein
VTDCPGCGAPLKDGAWTCGRCGAPVAGAGIADDPGSACVTDGDADAMPDAYGSFPGWAPEEGPQPAPVAAAGPGPSGLLRPVMVGVVVAVIAVLAVWFFVLRGPRTTGEEFLGTWTATSQRGIATAVVSRSGDAFSVTLGGSEQGEKITVPAGLDGAELVITMDDLSEIAGEGDAERFKAALKALAGDLRIVFTSVDATHLDLRIVGTAASGEDFDQTIQLVKEASGTT